MEKKLTKHGNSVALILDKALLKLLKMDESSIVNIAIKDGTLLITPTKKNLRVLQKKQRTVKLSMMLSQMRSYKNINQRLRN